MKKWFFIAIAFIAVTSAFIVQPVQTTRYGKTGANSFVKLDPSKEGSTGSGGWSCNAVADTCRFLPGAGINPSDPAGTVYTRSQMSGAVTSTINQKLSLIP